MTNRIQYSHDMQCPFGVRDLHHDECYSGNGINKCQYFIKYDWMSGGTGYVCCTCDKEEDTSGQLEFDF